MKLFVQKMSWVLILVLALIGCSAGDSADNNAVSPGAEGEPPAQAQTEVEDVRMFVYSYMDIPDSTDVEAKINTIMNPLRVHVVMKWTNASSYPDELQMKIAGGERVDLCTLTDNRYSAYVNNGSLLALDTYLEQYGQDILEVFSTDYQWLLDAVKVKGSHYSIPVLDNKFQFVAAGFQTEYLERHNIDTSGVSTYRDLTPILEMGLQNEPELKTLISGTQTFSILTVAFNGHDDFENLGDGIGVLMGEGNWDVLNLYETDEYAAFCADMHEWYKAGYISSDIATSGENADAYWKTGNAFAYLLGADSLNAEMAAAGATTQYGIDTTIVPIGAQKAVFLKFLQVIPATAQNPGGAMTFLNELYKNSVLVDTLYYGIEGADWAYNDDGCLEMLEGAPYYTNSAFSMMFGNSYIGTDRGDRYKGYNADCAEALKSCLTNRSLGFYFDNSPVASQYTAVKNVVAEYEKGLEYGILDPTVEIPNFIDKLKAAGIDDIIAEKQTQLDAWVLANGK